jgi:hypothetical protein
MHLNRRLHAVRLLNQICQRVKTGLLVRGKRLEGRTVVGIAALAHLHNHGVHVSGVQALQQGVHLFGSVEPLVEAVHPETAELLLPSCRRHQPCQKQPPSPSHRHDFTYWLLNRSLMAGRVSTISTAMG